MLNYLKSMVTHDLSLLMVLPERYVHTHTYKHSFQRTSTLSNIQAHSSNIQAHFPAYKHTYALLVVHVYLGLTRDWHKEERISTSFI